jgi:acetyl esterase/lipase
MLDVLYDPEKSGMPVVFFIHGGSWMTGSKDMYTELGENFLLQDFVSVIISYRLFPETDVYGMTEDCSDAFTWCVNHIAEFGGDPKKIFLAGHSAGGHLAAVTGLRLAEPKNNIAGLLMIDAFGLSAYYFLSVHGVLVPEFFSGIFGRDSSKWPLASPDKLARKNSPPFLVLTGGATYPFLEFDNHNFVKLLRFLQVSYDHITIPYKSHMQMIYEFENIDSATFMDAISWMKEKLS